MASIVGTLTIVVSGPQISDRIWPLQMQNTEEFRKSVPASPEMITELKNLGITETALASFFQTLDRNKVPANELDHELRKIAKDYLDLKTRIAQLSSEDPEVKKASSKSTACLRGRRFSLSRTAV